MNTQAIACDVLKVHTYSHIPYHKTVVESQAKPGATPAHLCANLRVLLHRRDHLVQKQGIEERIRDKTTEIKKYQLRGWQGKSSCISTSDFSISQK